MNNPFDVLSDFNKGIVLLVMGAILLLHSLGIIRNILSYFIIGFSLYLIFVGLVKINAYKKAMKFIKQQQKKDND